MAKSTNKSNIDTSTEEKIKEAARVVFTSKGYAATKVRDIAAQADINVSLLNYYFRSKEKLFQLIMAETIQKLFDKIQPIINDESTTITEKLENIVDHYVDLLIENPDLPLFVVNEIMSGSNKLPQMTDNGKLFLNSHFARQVMALQLEGKIQFHPVNIMMNLIGMIVFPFLSRPLILRSGALKAEDFRKIAEERKKLIPIWMTRIMNL
jgi:AcrR family transcriptional regulator